MPATPSTTTPVIKTLRAGASKSDPYTIAIVSNPALEAPWGSGAFVVDPVTLNPVGFDAACTYIVNALFGLLPGQAELLLADPAIGPNIRVVSVFVAGLPAVDANSLVAQDGVSNLLVARRDKFAPFLSLHGITADVAYGVSESPTHTRATAWHTTDDPARPGTPFSLDGAAGTHGHFPDTPGTVGLPLASTSLTALHEFAHAASDFAPAAQIVDQYVDGSTGVNNKKGARPVPPNFGTYNGTAFASDAGRDGLGYPAGWLSYHCALIDPTVPNLMDDYWKASPAKGSESCQFDKLTRQFLRDRLLAKLGR